jgi:hydroxymethylpyrimidine pyrophosphatase-like HAD family hydrolase
MKIVEGFDFTYFDCDDTLVMWDTTLIDQNLDKCITFENPSDKNLKWLLLPNENTIQALKQAKAAGSTIVVWSAGGWDWALEVVTRLELKDYVDLVISKPMRYYDDIPSSQFMGRRYDLKP